MKRRIIHIISLLLFTGAGCAQAVTSSKQTTVNSQADSLFRFERSIKGDFIYINVDVLDNIYLITAGNQLKKFNSKGDSVGVFNDVKKFGNPSYIDVSNPLKILVYYKNYSTVVILDRLLVQRNTINFRKQNIFSVKAIATSYDNNIWIFDEQDLKLKKINEEGALVQESSDMRLLTANVPSPEQIIDSDNLVYLYDPAKGFFIFDYYGALKNNIPFLNWTDIAVSGNRIMGFSGNRLFSYTMSTLNLRTYELPSFFKDYDAIKAVNGKVYVLKKDAVEIYSVQ